MTRPWFSPVASIALLALPAVAPAQVDFDALRAGVAGCPELAADPDVGNLGAFLCQPFDRTILDAPINLTGNKFWEVRAGSFHPYTRPSLLQSARGSLGDDEFRRLQSLLLDAQVLSRSLDAFRLALLAEGNAAGADAILGSPDDIFDANIPALLATRPDRDRYADLRSGLLHSLGARDTVSQYDPAFGETPTAPLGGVPSVADAEGLPVYTESNARSRANPFFFGPDGLRDTADDLPFVTNNERALAAGYSLSAPLQGANGTPENLTASFDGVFRAGPSGTPSAPVYSETAKLTVPTAADPNLTKVVELYGVYSDRFLTSQGCGNILSPTRFGDYDPTTGQCIRDGIDVTAEALDRGCGVRIRAASQGISVGVNADGQCIELNTSSPAPGSQLQFEVLELLGDTNARPEQASFEPVDLTDLRVIADFGELAALPARPRSPGAGNVAFPVAASEFRRRVDLATGAPVNPEGSTCTVRTSPTLEPLGPNGIAGDGDDVFPSAGYCVLWNVPDSDAPHEFLLPADIVLRQSANQALFHTLCTLSFDADAGYCALDALNYPPGFGLVSNVLSGMGVIGSVVTDGVETIQPGNPDGTTSVTPRGSNTVLGRMFLAVEPLALQDPAFQDLGRSLRDTQSALLGCGPVHAAACTSGQQALWVNDPAIHEALTRDPALGPGIAGGIDLMNADGSVFEQEFAVVKRRKAGALVGATADGSGQLVYLPGVNFSRTGQQAIDVDQDFTRQGEQIVVPQAGLSREPGEALPLTPSDVADLGEVGRAGYQTQAGNLREADGWVEPMPWTVDQELLDRFGAIVFNADPNNPLDLDSPLNQWNLIDGNGSAAYSNIDGEYCARWMNQDDDTDVATPFNLGCSVLETVSANFERLVISGEVIGQDRVFDAPESLAELVAMLDGDPANDASGDPIAGPDGIFARNQLVLADDEMDFEVIAAVAPDFATTFVAVPAVAGEDPKLTAAAFLDDYDPETSCPTLLCHLDVTSVLIDPDDARPIEDRTLILAMPLGMPLEVVTPVDPNDPNSDYVPAGFDRKVNLAALQFFELPALRRVLASRVVPIDTPTGPEYVRMSTQQRNLLFGELGSQINRGLDMDADQSADLDRNRDAIWDGQDDYLPGPISDDNLLCGSGIPGDLLQDGVQFSAYRADEKPGESGFAAAFPDGLAPRSPVFCRQLIALAGLVGPLPDALPGQSDAFLWHGGQGAPGTDDDADGFPDAVDNCATVANAGQDDGDTDGVGDVCDNCALFPNPRVSSESLAANPWTTTTGGQRDDDRDGFGNACDADFNGSLTTTAADTAQYRASIGQPNAADACGTLGNRPCAIFDLDPTGDSIDDDDSRRFRELLGSSPGPRCAACPLACDSADPGNCD
ncbi:MAG: thrombospondin type 3 repeat-containing protein [Myxococcota bacterium]